MNGHSRDRGNIEHKKQNEDKQNKEWTAQHRKLKRFIATWTTWKNLGGEPRSSRRVNNSCG